MPRSLCSALTTTGSEGFMGKSVFRDVQKMLRKTEVQQLQLLESAVVHIQHRRRICLHRAVKYFPTIYAVP